MLSVDHLTVGFGSRTLFEDVSFFVQPHDRIGLAGPNGSGKTTLMKILAGWQEADGGTINTASYVTVGYLPQEGITAAGKTLYAEAETAFDDLQTTQRRYDEAVESLHRHAAESPEHAELLEIIGELQHRLEEMDAYTVRSRIEKVLMGLGFSVPDLERMTDEFSGGWQMRIALAKLLLKTPSVLLLDEPTNHLDIESQAWLEQYLSTYDGAVILVSHDIVFLDSVTNRTLALERKNVEDHSGSFSDYLKHAALRQEQLEKDYASQQAHIKRTMQFVDRFRYKATKARQAQSRLKQLEKLERIELEDDADEIDFHFPDPPSSGRILLTIKDLSKSYGEKQVFRDLSLTVERGDRIAVVGVNGAGKSTMARILAGVEPFQSGERVTGHNLVLSYYAQHQADELDLDSDALGVLDTVATGDIRRRLRSILGSFLFRGDDVFKKVLVLSGGEKSRLALARMLLKPANLLILDEPTNHLDMRSKAVLQEALETYEGSFIIVSHDRGFLDPIVNKVVEVSTNGIRTFLMNVSEYLEKRQRELREMAAGPMRSAEKGPRVSAKERRRVEAERRKEMNHILQPLRKRLKQNEGEIQRLEAQIAAIESDLTRKEVYDDPDAVIRLGAELKELKKSLETVLIEWESVGVELEEKEKEWRE